jgi:phosphatidylserine/phosphatidylglycerophosphate/cardiolipin synthase-like enzyme
MHHKFLVGLSREHIPVWVVTGSFNASVQASRNIENALVIEDPALALAYYQEYQRIYTVSKPISGKRTVARRASMKFVC